MEFVTKEENGCVIRSWLPWDKLEVDANKQIMHAAHLPFVQTVCVMPDCHSGYGVPIGSVLACKGAISPASVGVDIGCGMAAMKVEIDPDKVVAEADILRHSIERSVPTGFNQHKEINPDPMHHLVPPRCLAAANIDKNKIELQCGTLGGGNHFIEICLDENRGVWVMIHSGSRNTGLKIANHYIDVAKKIMDKFYIKLPDPYLAYLPEYSVEFDDYWHDLNWAQAYAAKNREIILNLILHDIRHFVGQDAIRVGLPVNCHHNYATRLDDGTIIVRKGAISAKQGEMGIIPGSMGAKSYIVEGLGNRDSCESSSHGAGRKMGRGAARRAFTKEDLAKAMAGVSYNDKLNVVDEIPQAYKSIDEVMAYQADLVKPIHTLKQVLSIKGAE